MAIPPPPGPPAPPCPPPPPAMGGLKLGGAPSGVGDMRSALLQSIQKGKTLKKTVTVDKSVPALAGKVQGEVTTSTSPKRTPQSNINSNNVANGGPKLGGIFEGLSSMPKLKPVNGTRGTPSSVRTNKNTSSTVQQIDPITKTSPPSIANTNGPMDFNTELAKHLTLKRQKQQINATEANLRTNRGPPPQPPTQKNLSSSTSDSVLEKNNTSVRSAMNAANTASRKPSSPTLSEGSKSNNSIVKKNIANLNLSLGNSSNSVNSSSSPTPPSSATFTSSPRQSQVAPNKSTLFGSSSGNSSINSSNTVTQQTTTLTGNPNKPIVNHGKPNFAPKPPAIQQIIANGQRPTVSRHHSMKSPRSPPITTADGGIVYPMAQAFGTLRGPPQSFQSTEAINRHVAIPTIGRPTVAPPKPPAVKPPPPPTPARSISNTNLTNLPLSIAPTNAQSNTTAHSTAFNNVSTIRDQIKLNNIGSTNNLSTTAVLANSNTNNKQTSPVNNREKGATPNGGNIPLPPLPPHRTCPAPPAPQRQLSNSNIAPVPPQRHSSMRSGPGSVGNSSPTQSGGNNSVSRLITDLESKFANRFHNVTEFPSPPPFLSIQKSYPSRNNFTKSSNVSENRKARAPEPPGKQEKPTELRTFIQLTESKLCTTDGFV